MCSCETHQNQRGAVLVWAVPVAPARSCHAARGVTPCVGILYAREHERALIPPHSDEFLDYHEFAP